MTADDLIKKLNLLPHPEGGYYREKYRSEQSVSFNGKVRNAGTAIYFLLKDSEISHFHRVASDELWLFHQGQSIELYVLTKTGELEIHNLGNDLEKDELPQIVVKAGNWFAAKLKNEEGYSLVSCIVTPGFEFSDFELAKKDNLLSQFPEYDKVINKLSL